MIVDGLEITRVALGGFGIALRCKCQLARAVVCRLDRDGNQLRLGRAPQRPCAGRCCPTLLRANKVKGIDLEIIFLLHPNLR